MFAGLHKIEGVGLLRATLIPLKAYFLLGSYYFLFFYFSGFYIYFGNADKNPFNPFLEGLDDLKGAS
jgi:hypothetical protein